MSKENYSKNYIKIYFWKSISIISGFLSLLIVVPHLSNDIELYGVYTFCISFSLYLSYADIGFLNAGQKYASEAFARGNRKEEVEMLGFTGAILLIMIAPFSIAMIYFSFYPELVLNGLSEANAEITSNIFLILGIVLPFQVIIQRLVQSILIIRVKDYISLRIDVFFNLIKIASVYFFFRDDYYLIAEYYLFITLITIFSAILIMFLIQKTENYNFIALLRAIKLSKKQFDITKRLAYSSLSLTVGWLIYYELDLIFIGKLFGPQEVAIYSIGFTFLSFLRSLWSTVFSPYAQRFNHFAGTNSNQEIKTLASNIMDYSMPICIVVTVVLVIVTEYIVFFWVGEKYLESVKLMKVLIIGTGFGFVSQPAIYYFTAKSKYFYLYSIAIILPIIFIISAMILVPKMGIGGFAVAKTAAMIGFFLVSLIGISKLINTYKIFKKWAFQLLVFGFISFYIFPQIFSRFFKELHKSTTNLILLLLLSGIIILLSLMLMYLSQKSSRDMAVSLLKNKIKR